MANKVKVKVDHECRMQWAGMFPHITEDRDVFNRRSSSHQAELRANHDLVYNNPHAVSFLIYDPKTGSPVSGQILLSTIAEKLNRTRSSLPEVPAGFKFAVPDGIPRGVFSYIAAEPTEDQAFQILVALENHATRERIVEQCTYDKRLLADKPVDGVMAFVWRLARYMSGQDVHIPSTAFVDLADGCSRLTHLRVNPGRVKSIIQFLQGRAEELVNSVGRDRYAGDLRWARATGVSR